MAISGFSRRGASTSSLRYQTRAQPAAIASPPNVMPRPIRSFPIDDPAAANPAANSIKPAHCLGPTSQEKRAKSGDAPVPAARPL
jgi:hypothetical protein